MESLKFDSYVILSAAFVAHIGAMPEPPQIVKRLARKEWVQYALLTGLLYQSNPSRGWSNSLLHAMIIYLGIKFINSVDSKVHDASAAMANKTV